jgi:hypothetical protein
MNLSSLAFRAEDGCSGWADEAQMKGSYERLEGGE